MEIFHMKKKITIRLTFYEQQLELKSIYGRVKKRIDK